MSFVKIKSWDNRHLCTRAECINGHTYTRRVQWLKNQTGIIKIKMEIGDLYKEFCVTGEFAQKVFDKFKDGLFFDDCLGIFFKEPVGFLKSKKAASN